MRTTSEILGWYGVAAILGAYFLLSIGVFSGNDAPYHLLNLTGGIGIVISSWSKNDRQPIVINVIFGLIAIIGLSRILLF